MLKITLILAYWSHDLQGSNYMYYFFFNTVPGRSGKFYPQGRDFSSVFAATSAVRFFILWMLAGSSSGSIFCNLSFFLPYAPMFLLLWRDSINVRPPVSTRQQMLCHVSCCYFARVRWCLGNLDESTAFQLKFTLIHEIVPINRMPISIKYRDIKV